MGPIAGCRVGYINGDYVLNPTIDQLPNSQLDLLVAGVRALLQRLSPEAGGSGLAGGLVFATILRLRSIAAHSVEFTQIESTDLR